MHSLTVEDLIRAAKGAEGARLQTVGGRAFFTVDVTPGDRLTFTPESTGQERMATNRRTLEEVVTIYNRTGSLKIPAYNETGSRNLSYILRLVKMAADAAKR